VHTWKLVLCLAQSLAILAVWTFGAGVDSAVMADKTADGEEKHEPAASEVWRAQAKPSPKSQTQSGKAKTLPDGKTVDDWSAKAKPMIDRLPVANEDEYWVGQSKLLVNGKAKGRPRWIVICPAQEEEDVPTTYRDERPDPIPETKIKRGGYPITVTFSPYMEVKEAKAHLYLNGIQEVECWTSSPEAPANKDYAGSQQNTLCLIAKKPLERAARYAVEVEAILNGEKWGRKWCFNTKPESEANTDRVRVLVEEKDIAKLAPVAVQLLNRYRKNCGLDPVILDPEMSRACALHASYLKTNEGQAALEGLKAHEEDSALPGYTKEGDKAGRASVICLQRLNPMESILDWMNTLYHRVPLLAPGLKKVGFGCVRVRDNEWNCVMQVSAED
jgi:hypothetical protein